jgi:phosphinothricin acetyltransferase
MQDVGPIARIYNLAVANTVATFDTEPRSHEAQAEFLSHHDARHPVIVAELNGTVVGWAALSQWSERKAYDGTAEVSVYIDETWRGKGIGKRLLTDLIDLGRKAGLHTLLARIADGNEVSLRLHHQAGFQDVGVMREVGYKFQRWVDVHLLQLIFH